MAKCAPSFENSQIGYVGTIGTVTDPPSAIRRALIDHSAGFNQGASVREHLLRTSCHILTRAHRSDVLLVSFRDHVSFVSYLRWVLSLS